MRSSAEYAGASSASTPWSLNATIACANVKPPGSRRHCRRRNAIPFRDEGSWLALEGDERDRCRLRISGELRVEYVRNPVVPAAVGTLPFLEQAGRVALGRAASDGVNRFAAIKTREVGSTNDRVSPVQPQPRNSGIPSAGERQAAVRGGEVERPP